MKFTYKDRSYHSGETTPVGFIAYDGPNSERVADEDMSQLERRSVRRALADGQAALWYSWGRQDEVGKVDHDVARTFGECYAREVFEFEMGLTGHRFNVRTRYDKFVQTGE